MKWLIWSLVMQAPPPPSTPKEVAKESTYIPVDSTDDNGNSWSRSRSQDKPDETSCKGRVHSPLL